METVWVKGCRGSFTVEAVFIMTIIVWVIMGICYLSLYSHDKVALYTLSEHYLDCVTERGAEYSETETGSGLKKYLEEHLMILHVDEVSVKKEIVSVRAALVFHADVRAPLVSQMLGKRQKMSVCCGALFAPRYLWDRENVKEMTENP